MTSLPGNDFFFLSSMYSDRVLNEFLPAAMNRSYQRYMQIQKNILNSNEIWGSLKEDPECYYNFKESLELCEYFNVPNGSLFLDVTDQDFFVDIGDKMKFIKKFKSFETMISANDIIMNPHIFTHKVVCMIGDFFFDKFYFAKDKYRRTYIIIKNSTSDGIDSSVLQRLNASGPAMFCFWKEQHSASYTGSINLGSAIYNSTTAGMKKIIIPKTSLRGTLAPVDQNSWTILLPYDTITYKGNLYAMTNLTLTANSSTNLTFDIPEKFVEDIKRRNTSVNYIVIQKPNRKKIYSYTPSGSHSPILPLGDVDRPVSIANVKIYSYDEATATYKKRLPFESCNLNKDINFATNPMEYDETVLTWSNVQFPSIYDLTDIVITPIRIEIVEFLPNITNSTFDNHIKGLFDNSDGSTPTKTYSSQTYLDYYSLAPSGVKSILDSYNPKSFLMDYNDYKASGLDIRQYKMDKLIKLIESDPYVYTEYLKFMDNINYGIISITGSPKTMKFNTGLTGDLTGNNPVVTNDSAFCVNKNDEVFYFGEPHSYITVHSEHQNAFCTVFVGGRMIIPTRIKSKQNEIYIFLPQNTMKQYIQETVTNYSDIYYTEDLITVTVYPNISRDQSDKKTSNVTFENTTSSYTLFNGDPDMEFSLSDLVIVSSITGEQIGLENFDIFATIYSADIEFDDGTVEKVFAPMKEIIYLGTSLNEFYMTKDDIRIILNEETETRPFPDVSGGKSDGYRGFASKKWIASDLKLTLTNPDYVGTELQFIYSPVAYTWEFPVSRFVENPDTHEMTLDFGGFVGDLDIDKFEVFYNGECIPTDKYITLPNTINTDSKIRISLPYNNSAHFQYACWYWDGMSTHTNPFGKVQVIYNPSNIDKTTQVLPEAYIEFPSFSKKYQLFKNTFFYKYNDYYNTNNLKIYKYKDLCISAISLPLVSKINKDILSLQDVYNCSKFIPLNHAYNLDVDKRLLISNIHRDNGFVFNNKDAGSIIDQILNNYLH